MTIQVVGEVAGGMPRQTAIPVNIGETGLLSPTSLARDCFVYQHFSAKLQAYLIGYVHQTAADYSVYK